MYCTFAKSFMTEVIKQILAAFIKNLVYWFLLFAFTRLLYLIFNIHFIKDIDIISILAVFWHALPLDLSTACYLMLIPFLFIFIQSLFPSRWLDIVYKSYIFLFTLIFCAITTVEIGVYSEWKTKLHYKALLYLIHPREIFETAQTWQIIVFLLLIVIQVGGAFWMYNRFFFQKFSSKKRNVWISMAFFLLIPGILFLGMRGGAQQIPINQSKSYFSTHDILNLASLNSGWNLIHSVQQNRKLIGVNPFKYYDDKEAINIVKSLYAVSKDSTLNILKTNRPNIVVFILEGWSADIIESLGGEKGITPFFHELEKDGVLFTHIYSSGTRSQQGMSAIFSGFPSHPIATITEQPEKCVKLPSLPKTLSKNGYNTSFYFGGDITYGNLRSYLVQIGFDKIVDESDFPSSLPRGKLGVHDEFTLPYFISQLNKHRKPFFSSIFTVSTHSPYDMKMQEVHKWPKFEKKYVNAAYYADNCFKNFFEEAKKQEWYKNTLFIFISDHGRSTYRNWDYFTCDYHRIVFMMCGDVINDNCKGMKIDKIGSQVDVASTLLNQIKISDTSFFWSKNLLNSFCPEFAYYSFEEGLGWVRPGARYVFDARINKDYLLETDSTCTLSKDQITKEGKSYLQCVFKKYLDF